MNILSKITEIFPAPSFLNISATGVEISQDGLRFAVFSHDGGGLKLTDFGYTPSPSNNMFSDEIFEGLKKISEKKHRLIRATIPEESTYLFILPIEEYKDDIRSFIEFHIEENVPLSPRDAIFDYIIFKEEGKKFAAVTVVSRETVETHIEFYKKASLLPVSFIPESRAVAAALAHGLSDTSLVVHISKSKTIVSVLKQGVIRFTSAIQSGGSLVTDALSKYHNITIGEAENMKYQNGFDSDDDSHGRFMALANAMSPLRDEIERVILYWETKSVLKTKVARIIVSGSEANIPGLVEYMRESLKRSVEKGDAWSSMERYKKEVPSLPFKDSLAFAPIIGLFIA